MKRSLDLPVSGMDCASCASHVRTALESVEGVDSADIRLAAEKAVVLYDDDRASLDQLASAVASAGYAVPFDRLDPELAGRTGTSDDTTERVGLPGGDAGLARRAMTAAGLAFGAVLFVVVGGEWLGLFDVATERIPFPVGVAIVVLVGWPAFRSVVRAALRGRVIAHTLMTVGVLAALLIGQWVTAAVVAFFMRVGDFVEGLTMDRGRQALRELEALAPATARRVGPQGEEEVPVDRVRPGDRIVVRPGERVPVDGRVAEGTAAVEQAAITGESMPREVGPGDEVFAATIARGGALAIDTTRVGADATFGRIVRMVEEAEGNRGRVESYADRFSTWYLPVVGAIALATFLIRGDVLATAAVLVVACSCAFAIATPVAMLASIGSAARRGLLIKGGAFIEALAAVDTVLVDKTGTSTVGRPSVVRIDPVGPLDPDLVLRLAASAERDSEHPLAAAIRDEARARGLTLGEPAGFRALEGIGVTANVDGHRVAVGREPVAAPGRDRSGPAAPPPGGPVDPAGAMEAEGMTLVHVSRDGTPIGVIGLRDELRADVAAAIGALGDLGVDRIELLTGDHERAAAHVADALGIPYRAGLLPEDKIRIVEEYQARGHRVAMIGDGVNDAPALARADVGIAMAAAGTDLALEVAHVALLRDDWDLVPEAFRTARRTMGVVKGNFAFTGLYNLVGLSLAAVGILPPILAAAAQSLPDLGILGNSARLLRR